MTEYDDLLENARKVEEVFRSTAKEFIPRMYQALRNENENVSPEDVRDRIERDCIGIWSKRTILNALPDEAKNQGKQKAGRLSQKEFNSAAFSAAHPPIMERKESIQTYELYDFDANTRSTDAISLQEDPKIENTIPNLNECSTCQELYAEVCKLREALTKSTLITRADQINVPAVLYNDKNRRQGESDDNIEFEFSLPSENVRQYIKKSFNSDKIKERLWFSGIFNKTTWKVKIATMGRSRINTITELTT